jgi:hypothetical protein
MWATCTLVARCPLTHIQNDEALDKIAASMGETLDSSIKYNLRANLDTALRSNVSLYELKVEAAGKKIEEAVDRSTEMILSKASSLQLL